MDFLNTLPHKLKMDVTHIIHEKRYQNIRFLKDKSNSFLQWLCPLFTPVFFGAKQYIYSEGEDVLHINILLKGKASLVLPSRNNTAYLNIELGDHFGCIDIIGSANVNDFAFDEWSKRKDLLQR